MLVRQRRSLSSRARVHSWLRTLVRSVLDGGIDARQPHDLIKPTRLSNAVSVVGFLVMVGWALFECWGGNWPDLRWEIGLALGFAICPLLNVLGWHRAARTLLILVANGAIFVGAVMFERGSGGSLPFIAMIGLPFLLSRPSEKVLFVAGAAAAVTLFSLSESGAATWILGIVPEVAPRWYFAGNALTAFVCAFLLPLFLYRSNQRAEAELERCGKEKLDRLIQTNIIGVARGQLGGPILQANDALLNLLGYSREELRAGLLRLERITSPEYAATTKRDIAILEERGVSPISEREFVRKDGTHVPVLVGMASLDASVGDTIGFVLDISAQKSAEQHRELLRQSQEAMRMRDLFDSVVSHELKTPLATVTLQVELAARAVDKHDRDGEAVKRHLQRCRISAQKLAALINALLDSARIHHGKLDLALCQVDLAETANNVVSGLEAGGLCPPGLIRVIAPTPVLGQWDPLRIDEVLTNLCSNAIKYGAGAPVEVRVGANEGNEKCAHIEVVDHGIGIDDAMLNKIFDPFQRVAPASHVPGLGLGLHIVRSIVEGHGGTIGVKSERGHGSRFIVDLPRGSME